MGIRHSFENSDIPFGLIAKRCPACGEFPRGMVVMFAGRADIYTDDEGKTFVFNGSVIPTSEGSLVQGDGGKVTLVCGGGHQWESASKSTVKNKGTTG
jgi:hypothetical protein